MTFVFFLIICTNAHFIIFTANCESSNIKKQSKPFSLSQENYLLRLQRSKNLPLRCKNQWKGSNWRLDRRFLPAFDCLWFFATEQRVFSKISRHNNRNRLTRHYLSKNSNALCNSKLVFVVGLWPLAKRIHKDWQLHLPMPTIRSWLYCRDHKRQNQVAILRWRNIGSPEEPRGRSDQH